MFLNFLADTGVFSNMVDIVFFSAIGVVLVLVLIVFVASKIVQKKRDQKYEEMEAAAKQDAEASEETPAELTEEDTTPAENKEPEEPVVTEEPIEDKEPEEAMVAEEPVEEAQAEDEPVEAKKEEPKKTSKAKKTPANKSAAKKEEPVAEEPVEDKKEEPKKAATKTTAAKAAPKKKITEDKEESKSRSYSGKYEVYPSGDGYQYRLKASNGEVLVVSEVYTTKDSAMKAIDAVKRNVEDGEIRIIKDKRGLYKFKLISKNYRVLALGSSYSTEKSAVRSSESFKNFALKANIVEIDTPANQDNIVEPYLDISNVEEKLGGKYVIEKYDGEFSWDLKASNGQILCQAEGYTSKSGALSSIESFKKNVETGSFKILKDKNGNFHYNLYTASGRLATVGESYNSKQLAESAALSVVSYFKNAETE